MSDPTSPTAPDAAAPDVLVDHDHDLAAVVRAASIDEGSPGALYRCGPEAVAACVRALAADNERLREGFGRAVDAHEDDALAVWRALGGTHEPPDDTATIIDAIERLTAALARLRAPADLAATFPGATARPWAQFILRLPTVGAAPVVARPTALVFGPGDVPVCDTCDRGSLEYRGGPATATEVANAALIVAAVNAHDGLIAENARLLALLAAEREGHAAEVAGARAAALREAAAACVQKANEYIDPTLRYVAAECGNAVAALGAKGGG